MMRDRAQGGIRLDPAGRLVAVEPGQLDVHQDQIRALASRRAVTPSSPVSASSISKPGAGQEVAQDAAGSPRGPRRPGCAWLMVRPSPWRSTRTGTRKQKVEPRAERRLDPDPAAVQLDDPLGDREPEPRAALLAGARAVGLLELLEDPLPGRPRRSPGRCRPPRRRTRRRPRWRHDPHLAGLGELDGVAHEVQQHLGHPPLVAPARAAGPAATVACSASLFSAARDSTLP